MKKLLYGIIITGIGVFAAARPLQSQFVHLSMSVEPELSAQVVQNMDFGPLIMNSGTYRIERGSPSMGIFEIRSLNNQLMLVTLDSPEYLSHSDPEVSDRIPVSLEASYSNNGVQNAITARPFSGNTALFTIGSPDLNSQMASWRTAHIYIYGQVDIGTIREGQYSGVLVLNVEYY